MVRHSVVCLELLFADSVVFLQKPRGLHCVPLGLVRKPSWNSCLRRILCGILSKLWDMLGSSGSVVYIIVSLLQSSLLYQAFCGTQ